MTITTTIWPCSGPLIKALIDCLLFNNIHYNHSLSQQQQLSIWLLKGIVKHKKKIMHDHVYLQMYSLIVSIHITAHCKDTSNNTLELKRLDINHWFLTYRHTFRESILLKSVMSSISAKFNPFTSINLQ